MIRKLASIVLGLLFITSSINAQEQYKVKISTQFGDMVAVLYNETPLHRDNFIQKVKEGFYNGTLFHRVIPSFMAQGGDPNSKSAAANQALGADDCGTITAEINRKYFHKKGALAAARLPDGANPKKNSSACQFYIVQGYKHSDAQLNQMESGNYKFPDVNRAYYKVKGGYPMLDMNYTIFGEIIEGLDVLDLIHAMPTGAKVQDRPNTDIPMTITMMK